jgi:hypothetical protein
MSQQVAQDSSIESEEERIKRNWNELIQELRVTQMGVQILTAFLLTVPFQQRFVELTDFQRHIYLVTVGFSAAATALTIAPVAFHRLVFRRGEKPWLVRAAHHSAQLGLVCLAVAILGALWLVFDFVAGRTAALIVLAAAALFYGTLWLGTPLGAGRNNLGRQEETS